MAAAQTFENEFSSYCKQADAFADLYRTAGKTDPTSAALAQKLKEQTEAENAAIEASSANKPILQTTAVDAFMALSDETLASNDALQEVTLCREAIAATQPLLDEFDRLVTARREADTREAAASKTLSDVIEAHPVKFSPNVWTAICALGILYCAQLSFRPARIEELLGLGLPLFANSCLAIFFVCLFALLIFVQFRRQKAPDADVQVSLATAKAQATTASKDSAVAVKRLLDFDYGKLKTALTNANTTCATLIAHFADTLSAQANK